MKFRTLILATTVAALAAGGCQSSKSSNPLSPSVAGPIPGVTITTPKLLSPSAGTRIDAGAQPITLVFENASSTGQRPLSYVVELAMDTDFANKVLSRDGIAPGSNGQTSFKLPDALAADRTYYWRAKAQDGANTGVFTAGSSFSVFTPIVLQAPGLISPINDVEVTVRNPTLVVNNAARSGPVGSIVYEMQVSSTEAFSQIVVSMEENEQAGSTKKTPTTMLDYGTRYFWRARAWEMTKNMAGPWSATATFRTPAEPPPPPPPPPPPSGGGGGGGGNKACHVTGPLDTDTAQKIVLGCADEFPSLLGVYPTDALAEAAAFELLQRTIWHLQLAGFQAGRQQNPSGRISEDKLTIFIDGAWHAYDVSSVAGGRQGRVSFVEVWPASYVPNSGIPD